MSNQTKVLIRKSKTITISTITTLAFVLYLVEYVILGTFAESIFSPSLGSLSITLIATSSIFYYLEKVIEKLDERT